MVSPWASTCACPRATRRSCGARAPPRRGWPSTIPPTTGSSRLTSTRATPSRAAPSTAASPPTSSATRCLTPSLAPLTAYDNVFRRADPAESAHGRRPPGTRRDQLHGGLRARPPSAMDPDRRLHRAHAARREPLRGGVAVLQLSDDNRWPLQSQSYPDALDITSRPGNLNLFLGVAGLKINVTKTLLLNVNVLFPLSNDGLRPQDDAGGRPRLRVLASGARGARSATRRRCGGGGRPWPGAGSSARASVAACRSRPRSRGLRFRSP